MRTTSDYYVYFEPCFVEDSECQIVAVSPSLIKDMDTDDSISYIRIPADIGSKLVSGKILIGKWMVSYNPNRKSFNLLMKPDEPIKPEYLNQFVEIKQSDSKAAMKVMIGRDSVSVQIEDIECLQFLSGTVDLWFGITIKDNPYALLGSFTCSVPECKVKPYIYEIELNDTEVSIYTITVLPSYRKIVKI